MIDSEVSNFFTTNPNETETITISGSSLSRIEKLRNLRSMLLGNSELHYEIFSRAKATWISWCSAIGVFRDRHINEPLKSKIYRNAIYPVTHAFECWLSTKEMKGISQ